MEVSLKSVRGWFPAATSAPGGRVLDADGKLLGRQLRSNRLGVAVRDSKGRRLISLK